MNDDIIIGVNGSVDTMKSVIWEGLDHVRSLRKWLVAKLKVPFNWIM